MHQKSLMCLKQRRKGKTKTCFSSIYCQVLFSTGYTKCSGNDSPITSTFMFYSIFYRRLCSDLLVCVVAVVHVVSSQRPLTSKTCERHRGEDFFAQ